MTAPQPVQAQKKWTTGRTIAIVNVILSLIGILVFLSGIVPISHFLTAPNHPTVFYSELGVLTVILILSLVAIWKK